MKNISKIMLIIALIILGTTFIGCNEEKEELVDKYITAKNV